MVSAFNALRWNHVGAVLPMGLLVQFSSTYAGSAIFRPAWSQSSRSRFLYAGTQFFRTAPRFPRMLGVTIANGFKSPLFALLAASVYFSFTTGFSFVRGGVYDVEHSTRRRRSELELYAEILQLIEESPKTLNELAASARLNYSKTKKVLGLLVSKWLLLSQVGGLVPATGLPKWLYGCAPSSHCLSLVP